MTTLTETTMTRLTELAELPYEALLARFLELTGEVPETDDRDALLARLAVHLSADSGPQDATAAPDSGHAPQALDAEAEIDALRARYVEVVGRQTSSRDRRYLLWKIRVASQGKVPVGPVGRRQPGEPAVEHKVLPLRMPAETVDALDDVWRRHGLRSRMELIRSALERYLSGLGEEAAAARLRGT